MSRQAVRIGTLEIGGGAPIRVESMLTHGLQDLDHCRIELEELRENGCELARVAFPNLDLTESLRQLNKTSPIPLMADIHFDYRLALAAMEAGTPSIRVNPGNLGGRNGLQEVVRASKGEGVVIRVGANGGSLNNDQLEAADGDRGLALVHAVEEQLRLLLDEGFDQLILSAKSSSVAETVRANEILASRYPFPFHVGITEAGPGLRGLVKSSAGLGLLLAQGIGDTIRISLTGPTRQEVEAGFALLRSLDLRKKGGDLISCPTCGRRRVDVESLVRRVEALLPTVPDGWTVAVMGCEVNGPREASSADIGVAGTARGLLLFSRGKPLGSIEPDNLEKAFTDLIQKIRTEVPGGAEGEGLQSL
ncbi:MAG: (E)-4-hydroxy-3-methylbut-2-enyl-diphosphate synthase [Synergistaceae bacterium]|jgi:(E)-4-hydroxy-3-methylbut-2-enyl-diphosphate synthase|nr:(E)-4-hydroxy-3-methylbut-2-enyl-diphosphate synthase [Synergistaceae bacterium]